jgi:hypothetical protein
VSFSNTPLMIELASVSSHEIGVLGWVSQLLLQFAFHREAYSEIYCHRHWQDVVHLVLEKIQSSHVIQSRDLLNSLSVSS